MQTAIFSYIFTQNRSSHSHVLYKISIKNVAKFTGKQLCRAQMFSCEFCDTFQNTEFVGLFRRVLVSFVIPAKSDHIPWVVRENKARQTFLKKEHFLPPDSLLNYCRRLFFLTGQDVLPNGTTIYTYQIQVNGSNKSYSYRNHGHKLFLLKRALLQINQALFYLRFFLCVTNRYAKY